jgi:arylsulfatase A-like enzyme
MMKNLMKRVMISSTLPLAFLAQGAGVASQEVSSADRPNLVFILADDMGYGDVGVYNPESKIPTPNLDRMASQGMRFTDAHAAGSICVPSRYGLMTGRSPYRSWRMANNTMREQNGREIPNFGFSNLRREPDQVTVADLLRENGYATACFGKWHLGMDRYPNAQGKLRGGPVDKGFDYYFGVDAPEQPPYAFIKDDAFIDAPTDFLPEQMGDDVTNPKSQGAHWYEGESSPGWDMQQMLPTIQKKAVAYIQDHVRLNKEQPFFIYHSLPAPHAPWVPLDSFNGISQAGSYGDYVAQVDACVGEILKTLDNTGIREKTLVIFSSDNGPVWYPQDVARYKHDAAGGFRGMKGHLHEAGHRMPFIATMPGRIPEGVRSDALINFTDMMATFTALAGGELPPGAGEDSVDISPVLFEGAPSSGRSYMVQSHSGVYTLAIREGDWKLILPHWRYFIADNKVIPEGMVDTSNDRYPEIFELYNLKTDPSEKNNLYSSMPEKAQQLFNLLKTDVERGRSVE